MPLPAWVNNGTANNTASATSLAPAALPGSLVNNNILVSWIGIKITGESPTVGGGWSTPIVDNTGNESGAWSWRVVDGTEAVPTWSWVSAAAATTQIAQFTTPNPGAPIGVTNSADANASTTLTVASLTTTSDNSLIVDIYLASNSQTLGTPSGYTQRAVLANANTSYAMNAAPANKAGAIDAVSLAVTSSNWVSFGIELLGSGAGADNTRATQVVVTDIETYSDAIEVRASQVVAEAIESYSTPILEVRASQVVLQVLRTVAAYASSVTPVAYLTNCDTDVTYPTGPRWSSRTVRVDQAENRPLVHWKRGLDVDRWTLVLMPRLEDPITHEIYPDKLNGQPWIQAARSGALDGCEVEVFRAYWPKWPEYQPIIIPTGIISIFAGRVAETDVTDTTVILTLNDLRELLTTTIPVDVYSAQCRHTLFDFGCGLIKDSFVNTGTVAAGSTQSTIIAQNNLATGLAALGNGTLSYTLGTIIFTGGNNTGFSRSIVGWTAPGTLNLINPLPFAVKTGDAFSIYPGCNKTQDNCTAFNNLINFGGFPYIPTIAAALG